MALSFDVNINLGSQIGFTMPKDPNLAAYVPDIATTFTLDGVDIPYTGIYSSAPLLSVSASPTSANVALSDYVVNPATTSTFQSLYLTNNGNAPLIITDVIGTYGSSVRPVMSSTNPTLPITIQPGTTKSISSAYYATEPGIYDNFFVFKSNSINGWVKINTHQVVPETQDFRLTPTKYTTSTNTIGNVKTNTYTIIPIFNGVETPNTVISFIPTISTGTGWTISSTGTNYINVQFDTNTVNNVNGTYTSILTVLANGATHTATNTSTVFINTVTNKHFSSWLSPVSHDNSIVGVSYDLEDSKRIMTIGVGTSSGALVVTSGDPHLYVTELGLGRDYLGYGNWSKVYRFPFTGSAQVYKSKDYVVKTTTATDYSSYFGEFDSAGSMFIVTDDGYGNILVELNNLIIFDTDTVTTSTAHTLHNLTRSFHYYSNIDIDGRYTPLPTEYANPLANDPTTTQLFIGFNYNTRTKAVITATSIVSIPTEL